MAGEAKRTGTAKHGKRATAPGQRGPRKGDGPKLRAGKVQVFAQLRPDVLAKLDARATADNRSRSNYIETILTRHVEEAGDGGG